MTINPDTPDPAGSAKSRRRRGGPRQIMPVRLRPVAERLAPVVEAFLDRHSRREPAITQAMSTHLGEALGTDFFSVREQFTGEQWSHFTAVRKFVDEEVVPVADGYWEWAEMGRLPA